MVQPAPLRIRQHDLAPPARPLLEHPPDARDRAARPCPAHKRIDAPGRLGPDLARRALAVRAQVRQVLELVGEQAARRVDVPADAAASRRRARRDEQVGRRACARPAALERGRDSARRRARGACARRRAHDVVALAKLERALPREVDVVPAVDDRDGADGLDLCAEDAQHLDLLGGDVVGEDDVCGREGASQGELAHARGEGGMEGEGTHALCSLERERCRRSRCPCCPTCPRRCTSPCSGG